MSRSSGLRYIMSLVAVAAIVLATAAGAATVDSSYGWTNPSYSVANTVDGVYGTSNMGWAEQPGSWVIYDFGGAMTVSKIRICAPYYGGSGQDTFNLTSGTLEFSNDKSSWSAAIGWSAPPLESIGRTDCSECALPQPMSYRYMRWRLPGGGRVGEIWFVASPQLAVWEMNEDNYYTNNYPAWQTVDGLSGTFAAVSGDPGGWGQPYITYDLGAPRMVHGFSMQGRSDWPDLGPTGGELWVSESPTSGYVKVGNWTMPGLAVSETRAVEIGTSKRGRYVQLRNLSGGNQWAEFAVLSNPAGEVLGISAAKMLGDNTYVDCTGTVIATFSGRFYIEAEDRSNGIRVDKADYTVIKGQSAHVVGLMKTDPGTGERYIAADDVSGSPGTPVEPLGATNRSVGGG